MLDCIRSALLHALNRTRLDISKQALLNQLRSLSESDPDGALQFCASLHSDLWAVEQGLSPSNIIAFRKRASR